MSNEEKLTSNLFLNSHYDMWEDELCIVMKDVDTMKKTHHIIKGPMIDLYRTKEVPKVYEEFIHISKVNKLSVKYRSKDYEIAKMLGLNNFKDIVKASRESSIRKDDWGSNIKASWIRLNKEIFGSDIDIRDFQLMKYMDSFPKTIDEKTGYPIYNDVPPIRNLHKGYLDLEWDISVSPEPAEQPIYMGTYTDAFHNVTYTYYLDRPQYNGVERLKKNSESVIQEMKEILNTDIENLNIKNEEKKETIKHICETRIERMEYITKAYDSEAELIKDLCKLVFKEYSPDFLLIFNAQADIGQIEMRSTVLGLDVKEMFSHPDFKRQFVDFDYRDRKFSPSERRHNYDCSSYTKIVDSMITYYSIRKATGFSSYNLSDTVDREVGIRKLPLGMHISELPLSDYVLTYMYNVRDVIVMVLMEDVVNDVEFLLSVRFLARTEYDRVFVPLSAVMTTFYHLALRNGKVMQPNINKILSQIPQKTLEMLSNGDPLTYKLAQAIKDKKKVEGGLCSDPNKFVGPGRKPMLSFLPSAVVKDVVDEDAKSMYPRNLISSLISKSQLVGRITKKAGMELTEEDAYKLTLSLINRDILGIAETFFDIPEVNELLEKLGLVRKTNAQDEVDKNLSVNMDINTMPDLYDPKKLKELSKALVGTMNFKFKKDDDPYNFGGVFILSDDNVTSYRKNGAKLSYSIKKTSMNLLGKDIMTPYEYISLNSGKLNNPDYIVYDPKLKNNQSKNHLYDEWFKLRREPLETLDLVGSTSIHEYMTLLTPRNLKVLTIPVNDVKVDLSYRIAPFSNKTFSTIYEKNVKKFFDINKFKICRGGTIDIRVMEDSVVDADVNISITNDKSVDITDRFTITPSSIFFEGDIGPFNNIYIKISSDKKVKTVKVDVIDVTLDLYALDVEEDYMYKAVLSYTNPIDNDYSAYIQQEMIISDY